MAQEQLTAKEASLIIVAGTHKRESAFRQTQIDFAECFLIKMAMDGRMTEEELRQYLVDSPSLKWIHCDDSSKLGELSVINMYQPANKNKAPYPAHFTIYGHYLRHVTPNDDKPAPYAGNFKFKDYHNHFRFQIPEKPKDLTDFFVIRKTMKRK
jgi:DNA-binding transcriptional regulator YdaS (Cro superfamily)